MKYSLTNFNEGMGVFIHSSLIPKLLKFMEYHDVKSGWGFDGYYLTNYKKSVV
jgi:hypothetical protein